MVSGVVSPSPVAASAGHSANVRAWLTTGDQRNLLTDRSDMLGPPDAEVPTITVDAGERHQTVAGFGASITDSSAYLLAPTPHRHGHAGTLQPQPRAQGDGESVESAGLDEDQ